MTSIYVHIPFCESKCYYCDFCSGVYNNNVVENYVTKLTKEIVQSKISDDIGTIFIGGGTPSSINSSFVGNILDTIYKHYNVAKNAEISIECNPNSLNLAKATDYKKMGINRVSLGVQTTSNDLLKRIGRIHDYEQVKNSAEILANNFANYNFDLMIGLPNQTIHDVENTITDVLKYTPTHISAYSLILEPNTALSKMVNDGGVELPNEDYVVEQYNLIYEMLKFNGYNRYEISNFSKPNYECKHNENYWACGEYFGFGLAAHSYKNGVRFSNTNNMKNYLDGTTKTFEERLTLQEQKEEMIMLALRTEKGLNLGEYATRFGENLISQKQKSLENLQKENLIIIKNGYLKIAPNAFYISNSIIEELI